MTKETTEEIELVELDAKQQLCNVLVKAVGAIPKPEESPVYQAESKLYMISFIEETVQKAKDGDYEGVTDLKILSKRSNRLVTIGTLSYVALIKVIDELKPLGLYGLIAQ